jgi:hypothetical protein
MLVEADPVTDAIAGLRAKGHTVEPCGEDPALWRIDNDDQELTVCLDARPPWRLRQP